MRSTIKKIDPSWPIVTPSTGIVSDQMRLFLLETQLNGLLIGTGTPEGNVEASQGQEYMDETGLPGAVKYIKQLADIAGDRSKGWVAIG